MDIKHEQYVPITQAIAKYKTIQHIHMSDRWIQHDINFGIGGVLMIQKIKNRWVCSKERL